MAETSQPVPARWLSDNDFAGSSPDLFYVLVFVPGMQRTAAQFSVTSGAREHHGDRQLAVN